jgi:carboxymethylenebutenolidase
VLVLQEAFGVNDHIEDVTRRFAKAGYRAVAPHLFHRSGDPVLDYGNFEKIMPHMQALSEAGLLADLDASLAYLSHAGFPPSVSVWSVSAWAGR